MKKSEQTRAAILKAAGEFFWDHPLRDLTIAELMSRVGASRPTFYQYFSDLHEMMAELLEGLRTEIMSVSQPWFFGDGDPITELKMSLRGLVEVCYAHGPLLRAITDASVSDENLEEAWAYFLHSFDEVVTAKIEEQQAKGLIPAFAARPIAIALNRLDAAMFIEHFGQQPRRNQEDVLVALTRIWCLTLYGSEGNKIS